MSVPHRDDEPDEPATDGEPGGRTGDEPSSESGSESGSQTDGDASRDREQAAWEAIVAAYGERPAWEGPEPGPPPPDPAAQVAAPQPGRDPGPAPDPGSDLARGEHEPYRPPPPPPLPWVAPSRLVAWFGLLGVPALVLVALVVGIDVPSWLGTLLMVWFVGGFCYLVASMRTDRGDGPDDGAVL